MTTTTSSPSAAEQRVLKEQFDDLEQQRETNTFGMWVFLATEILLFGGLFLGYTAYRCAYYPAFALGSSHTDYWLGTINTGVLLTSSLTMALAVRAAKLDSRRGTAVFLLLTLLLGAIFLVIKGTEYHKEWTEHLVPGLRWSGASFPPGDAPHAALFFIFYFLMTGLHAIHLTIALGIVLVMLFLTLTRRISAVNYSPVEITGLFWHLVDVAWVFLYPIFYLVGHR